MALVRGLNGAVIPEFWRLAVCPLFPVGSRQFPIACSVGADPLTVRVASPIGRGPGRCSESAALALAPMQTTAELSASRDPSLSVPPLSGRRSYQALRDRRPSDARAG